MKLAERLKIIRATLDLEQKELAERLGISTGSWQVYEYGKSVPGGKVLSGLAKMGVSADWLLTGEGPMMRGGAAADNRPPTDADLWIEITEAVLMALEKRPRPAPANLVMELIREIHDEVKEGEMRRDEVQKNVIRILKFAS